MYQTPVNQILFRNAYCTGLTFLSHLNRNNGPFKHHDGRFCSYGGFSPHTVKGGQIQVLQISQMPETYKIEDKWDRYEAYRDAT
jgi:hypothetical protein